MSDTQPITVTPEILANLHAGTPQTARKQRQGPGGKLLTYVDARYVMAVLDTEVGPANWQDEFAIGSGGKVSCRIGIFVDGRDWVWKGDGAGETDIEGEKGSFSDAFKRAAVKWGIARDLYGEEPAAPANNVAVMDAATRQALAREDEGPETAEDGGSCPEHGTPWSVKPAGQTKAGKSYKAFWKCDGRTNGNYCNNKPDWGWVNSHPAA